MEHTRRYAAKEKVIASENESIFYRGIADRIDSMIYLIKPLVSGHL